MICQNEAYSTTRRVTEERPIIENQPADKFASVLFLPEGEGRQGEGGLRTHGYFKANLNDTPLITVITVVFNGAKYLEETILSVINQTYDNVEYIIIDGGSTDGTLDIIKKYQQTIDYWVSEQDGGIYDAMNKGIDLITGAWVNFMNGGDEFYDNYVLNEIFKKQDYQNCMIIYGNHEVKYPSGRKRQVKAGLPENLWKGSQFCHQASFINSQFQKGCKFNIYTKIVADFEFFYLAWKNNIKFQSIDSTVCSFESGGLSDVRRIDSIVGRWYVVEKTNKVNLYYILLIIKEMMKKTVKVLF